MSTHALVGIRKKNIEPRESLSNPSLSAAPNDDMNAAWQNIGAALDCAFQLMEDLGVHKNLAVAFRDDPLQAEIKFNDSLIARGLKVLGGAFERMDDHGPTLEVDGERYTKVAPSTGRAMTLLGQVEYGRSHFRPVSKSGKSLVPVDHYLGLIDGGLTPAASRWCMALTSNLTARESADVLKRITGEAPAISTLARLSAEAGQCLEECLEKDMPALREQEGLPKDAASFQVSLDGTMMRMIAEKNGDDVTEEAGWRESSCGVFSIFDKDGIMLQRRYIGRLPE